MKKHWSIQYIFLKLQNKYYSRKERESPWLPYDCIKFLKQYLKEDDVFLETGSGSSTLWFSKLVKEIISIEHDSGWYKIVCERIAKYKAENIKYYHESKDFIERPFDSNYVQRVASFKDHSFDAILVDGKHRSEIALLALDKIKSSGIIIVDNVERYLVIEGDLPEGIKNTSQLTNEWKLFKEKTDRFRSIVFSDGITSTKVFFINN